MPRGDDMRATYVIWDPTKKGKEAFKPISVPYAGWKKTLNKMKKVGLPDKFKHIHSEVA